MTTVLVTGALGVIGTHLTEYLRNAGYDVLGADLAIRDYDDYVRADVTSFEDLHRVGRSHRVNMVIHMAGEVGRMVGENHPQRMVYVNDVGTLNIIQFCLEHEARLIYFSTSEVYGRLLDRDEPVTEAQLETDASAFVTTNIYAMSKLFGEALVKHFVTNYGLQAITIRPFMVYGPGEAPSKWRSAITNFVAAARHKKELVVHDGTVRAWCFISDFIQGVRLLAEQAPAKRYEAYNVGSDEYLTMAEVARTVCSEVGASQELVRMVPPPAQFLSPKKRASIAKLRALGYQPRVTLREGVRAVAEWQAANGY
jgi:nucleoside-diphosphate-sugar epimerase